MPTTTSKTTTSSLRMSTKKIMAVAAAACLLALWGMTSQASAQDAPTMSADPAAVPGPGEHTFTVTGANWNPGSAIFIVPCTVPGEQLTTATPVEDLIAVASSMSIDDCRLAPIGAPITIGDDGTFTAEITYNVTANFAFGGGDVTQTQTSAVPVLFVADSTDDIGDDITPEGGAQTGFGGTAGSDGNTSTVPVAATVAALTLLGAATLASRRNA